MELLYETEAVRLSVSEEGRVDGVVVRGRDGLLRTLGARRRRDRERGLRGQQGDAYASTWGSARATSRVIAPGPANNRGEGIRMAMEVGADTAGQFDMFHAEPVDPRASKPDPVFYPYVYGIVVNGRAERFFDEGRNSFDSTFEALGYEIWRNQGQTAFFIGDQTTLGIEPIEAVIFTDVPPVTADTIGALAAQLGLDPRRSSAPSPSTTPPSGRSRSTRTSSTARARVASRRRSRTGPSRSTRRRSSRTRSRARSRSRSAASARTARRGWSSPAGTPIPGLYAAGEVTGLYYHEYPAGTSVLRSLTFGRLAGAHAAAKLSGPG